MEDKDFHSLAFGSQPCVCAYVAYEDRSNVMFPSTLCHTHEKKHALTLISFANASAIFFL
jgi:hypothetical protein